MTDAEKVRRAVEPDEHGETSRVGDPHALCDLLAARVRELEAENARLREGRERYAREGVTP